MNANPLDALVSLSGEFSTASNNHPRLGFILGSLHSLSFPDVADTIVKQSDRCPEVKNVIAEFWTNLRSTNLAAFDDFCAGWVYGQRSESRSLYAPYGLDAKFYFEPGQEAAYHRFRTLATKGGFILQALEHQLPDNCAFDHLPSAVLDHRTGDGCDMDAEWLWASTLAMTIAENSITTPGTHLAVWATGDFPTPIRSLDDFPALVQKYKGKTFFGWYLSIDDVSDCSAEFAHWLIREMKSCPALTAVRKEHPPLDPLISISQAAATINLKAKTLQNRKCKDKTFPSPDRMAGKGKKENLWLWSRIKPYLESLFGRTLDHIDPRIFDRKLGEG